MEGFSSQRIAQKVDVIGQKVDVIGQEVDVIGQENRLFAGASPASFSPDSLIDLYMPTATCFIFMCLCVCVCVRACV